MKAAGCASYKQLGGDDVVKKMLEAGHEGDARTCGRRQCRCAGLKRLRHQREKGDGGGYTTSVRTFQEKASSASWIRRLWLNAVAWRYGDATAHGGVARPIS